MRPFLPGQEAGDRADIEDAAAILIRPSRTAATGPRRADVDRDHAELCGVIQFGRLAEQAITGIVDDIFDVRARGGDGLGDPVAGVGAWDRGGREAARPRRQR
jgi:hypothetical protein